MAQRPTTVSSVVIGADSAKTFGRAIAKDSIGGLHAVWSKDGATGIFYATSTDGGQTWEDGEGGGAGSSFQVSSSLVSQKHPSIVVDSLGNIHVVWDDQGASPKRINYRRKVSGVWQTEDTASIASGTKALENPNLITHTPGSVTLHVVGTNTTDNVVFWARSTDGGATWALTTNQITSPTCQSGTKWGFDADSNGNLHLVYILNAASKSNRRAVYVKATLSAGPVWTWGSTSTDPWGNVGPRGELEAALVVNSLDDIYLVFVRENLAGSNVTLKWTRSTDGGSNWSSHADLGTGTESMYEHPTLGVDSHDDLHFVASAVDAFSPIITTVRRAAYCHFNKKRDFWVRGDGTSGASVYKTWEGHGNDDATKNKIIFPSIVRSSDSDPTIPVIYQQQDFSFARFTSFSTRKRSVTDLNVTSHGLGLGGGIVKDSLGNLHAAFRTDSGVFYATSTDGGDTWTDGDGGADNTRHTIQSSSSQFNPAIAVDSANRVHVVWHNNAASPSNLKYARRAGGIWDSVITLSGNVASRLADPVILVAPNDSVHIFAPRGTSLPIGIYWARSTDNGQSFTQTDTIFSTLGAEQGIGADADKDNNLHIAWRKHSPRTTSYAKAAFSGPSTWTWGAEDSASIGGSTTTNEVDLIIDRRTSNIYVAWKQDGDILRYNRQSGGIWGAATDLVGTLIATGTDRREVSLSSDGAGNIHAFWLDDTAVPDSSTFNFVSHSRFDKDTLTWSDEGPIHDFQPTLSGGVPPGFAAEKHSRDDDTLIRFVGLQAALGVWMDVLDAEENPTKTSTVSGKAHIKATITSDIDGNAFINRAESVGGEAHILAILDQDIGGNAHLQATISSNIDGNAHLRLGGEEPISGNAHIQIVDQTATVDGNAHIKIVETSTVDGNAHINSMVSQSIGGNASITFLGSQVTFANAVIESGPIDLRLFTTS